MLLSFYFSYFAHEHASDISEQAGPRTQHWSAHMARFATCDHYVCSARRCPADRTVLTSPRDDAPLVMTRPVMHHTFRTRHAC